MPQGAFDQALDRLRNTVVNAPEPNKDNAQALAYALYVLARNGRPVIGDLRYLSDAKLDAFSTPLAKAQLGAGAGDARRPRPRRQGFRRRAGRARRRARPGRLASRLRLAPARRGRRARAPRRGQSRRRQAPRDAIPRAGAAVEAARAERSYTSTQEKNWMVLAAEALAEHGEPRRSSASTGRRSRARSTAASAARPSPSRSPSPTPARARLSSS